MVWLLEVAIFVYENYITISVLAYRNLTQYGILCYM